jgi:hypothetical protein
MDKAVARVSLVAPRENSVPFLAVTGDGAVENTSSWRQNLTLATCGSTMDTGVRSATLRQLVSRCASVVVVAAAAAGTLTPLRPSFCEIHAEDRARAYR